MPKPDGSMTVAERRAAGTNKAAQNKAAKKAGSFTGNVGKAPAPTKSIGTTGPKASDVRPPKGTAPASSLSSSVAERRSAGTNNAAQNQAAKAGGTFNRNVGKAPAPTNQQVAKERAAASVQNNTPGAPGYNQTQSNQEVSKYGGKFITTAAGHRVEQGAHSAIVKGVSAKRREESMKKYGAGHNDNNYVNGEYVDFDDEGYFNADTTKAMWQDTDMLRDAGYKVGDTLWRPGSKDGLNGNTFTGKIRSDANGVFVPEFEENIEYFNKEKRLKEDSQFLNRYIPNEYSDVEGQHHANYFKNNITGLEGLNSTEKLSTEGLYQDKYYGPSHGDAWTDYVGTSDDREGGVGAAGKKTDGFYDKAQKYMAGGGYAGDVLKQIDNTPGEKDRLSSPDQIAWYNSLVQRSKDFDWSATYDPDPNKGSANADPRGKGVHDGRTATGHTSMKSYTPATYDNDGNVSTPSSQSAVPSNSSYNSGPSEYGSASGQSNSQPQQSNTNGYNKQYSGFDYKPQQQQPYTNPFSKSTKPDKALNIDFDFDPNRFNQGQ